MKKYMMNQVQYHLLNCRHYLTAIGDQSYLQDSDVFPEDQGKCR